MTVFGAAKLFDAMPLIAVKVFRAVVRSRQLVSPGNMVHGPHVRSSASQDVTNNPLWTGKTEGLGAEDEHMQTFMTRFAGLDSINDAGAKKGTGGGGSAAEGKGKGDAK